MSNYKNVNYKASSPEDTIKRIRNILYENNIFVIENKWNKVKKNLSSVGLKVYENPISTAGKGINKKYALASGYGEFMERLQNLLLIENEYKTCEINDNSQIKFSDLKNSSYLRYKDNSKDHKNILKNYFYENEFDEIDNILEDNKNMALLPFSNIFDKQKQYIPFELFRIGVGSNGMCAGNTKEEAFVQGLCEIFERHILYKIYFNDLILPSIPKAILKKIPQWDHLKLLEKNGFTVEVKDASLEGKFPVVALVIKKNNKAQLCLGSAPDYKIALERCITEMFQGSSLKDIEKIMKPIKKNPFEKNKFNNFSTLSKRKLYQYLYSLKAGRGILPSNIFKDNKKFNKNNLYENTNIVSKQTMDDMLNIVKKMGYKVLVRNVSFLSFPSYHIYIPGMSEVVPISKELLNLKVNTIPKAQNIFFNIDDKLDFEKVDYIKDTLNKMMDSPILKIDNRPLIAHIHDLPLDQEGLLNNMGTPILLMLLYYRAGDLNKSYNIFENYLKDQLDVKKIDKDNIPQTALPHYVLLEMLELLKDGKTLEETKNKVLNKYSVKIVEDNYSILDKKKSIKELLGIPEKTDCKSCKYRNNCLYINLHKIIKNIKPRLNSFDFTKIS